MYFARGSDREGGRFLITGRSLKSGGHGGHGNAERGRCWDPDVVQTRRRGPAEAGAAPLALHTMVTRAQEPALSLPPRAKAVELKLGSLSAPGRLCGSGEAPSSGAERTRIRGTVRSCMKCEKRRRHRPDMGGLRANTRRCHPGYDAPSVRPALTKPLRSCGYNLPFLGLSCFTNKMG